MDCDAHAIFDIVSHRLPAAGIDAIMIGGHAVNHYGVVRATQDIDFMITTTDEHAVRRILRDAGFTNIAVHEMVTFFSRPGSSLRIDFLKVDRSTMDQLLANAETIEYFDGHRVKVPRLRDLLAMKLFSLTHGDATRQDKDFPDIVHLVIENGVNVETELQELSQTFGTDAIYAALSKRIKELIDA
ncbi:MAG: nucleotidyltransferase [Lentisphaerae bacterium]|nr:nucleotidyltransferase [Lentisphaerota bacterium]